jgi:hypothetical protein
LKVINPDLQWKISLLLVKTKFLSLSVNPMCLLFRFPVLSVLNDSNRLLGVNCAQDPHLFLVKPNLVTKFTTQNHLKSSVLPKILPFFSRFLLVKPESLLVKSAGARGGSKARGPRPAACCLGRAVGSGSGAVEETVGGGDISHNNTTIV